MSSHKLKLTDNIHEIDLGPWPTIILVTDDKEAYEAFERDNGIDFEREWIEDIGSEGYTASFVRNGATLVVMIINPSLEGLNRQTAIVHEASHAVDFLFDLLGEKSPGTEARAYLIDHIFAETSKALADG